MKVLIIGSGGREHALAWKLAQSQRVEKVFTAPGNAGTGSVGENVPLAADDLVGLGEFARDQAIDFTVVGPDDALAAGIVDHFTGLGLRIFGPTAEAAKLESSKSFAKDFMRRHGIPTAAAETFTSSQEAHAWCTGRRYPLVIKADGLALGKGVAIAEHPEAAAHAIYRMMELGVHGDAGRKLLIEEFLEGPECSIHAAVDASGYCLFPDARDHKRAFDGDQGPNTGGMGAVSPSRVVDAAMAGRIRTEILDRFVAGIRADGIAFRGLLFPGLILTPEGPKVLEFNCRFGDPETQVLVRRMKSDLLDVLEAVSEDSVASVQPEWDEQHAACVILASGGYPGPYGKGKPISGLEQAGALAEVEVFHAGTRRENGKVVTAGGRVLGVTALGASHEEALHRAYAAADQIEFEDQFRRNDIGRSCA